MNLDFYPGQRVECVQEHPLYLLFWALNGIPAVELGAKYTIASTEPCKDCGVHLGLRELATPHRYSKVLFKPLEPTELAVLRRVCESVRESEAQKEPHNV